MTTSKKKYNNQSKQPKNWTNKHLTKMHQAVTLLIWNNQIFLNKNLYAFYFEELLELELLERGLKPYYNTTKD